MDDQREKYITATKKLAGTLGKLVENAKKKFSLMPMGSSMFASMMGKGIKGMAEPIWSAYWEWLNALGVETRQEMEEVQKSFGDDKNVLKCTEELHAAEAGFYEIAGRLNAALQKQEDKIVPSDEDKITLGSTFSGDAKIIDVDSGEKKSLGSCFANSPYTLFILIRHFA